MRILLIAAMMAVAFAGSPCFHASIPDWTVAKEVAGRAAPSSAAIISLLITGSALDHRMANLSRALPVRNKVGGTLTNI